MVSGYKKNAGSSEPTAGVFFAVTLGNEDASANTGGPVQPLFAPVYATQRRTTS
jgi:hypothetical protein